MKEANVNRLAGEFRTVHRELLGRIETAGADEVDAWAKKRQAIVDRIFDHLHEKTGFKKEANKAAASAGL